MPKYRVKQGKKFGPGGRHPAGAILEMSEQEAKPFADILERAADNALVGSTQATVPHEPLQFPNELGAEVPEDLKIMPGTLGQEEEVQAEGDIDLAAEEDLPETLEDVPADVEAPRKRKTAGKSTRKRANEE